MSCNGTPDEVFTRILTALDPFQIRLDNPETTKNTEDLADGEF